MSRGHISISKGFPVGPQEAALAAANVKIIYRDDLANSIKHLRKGEPLYAHTLRGLAQSRKAIDAALEEIHEKGAYVVDCTTGWRSDGPKGFKLLSQAIASLSRERQGGGKRPEKNGAKGGRMKGVNIRAKQMPERAMERIWFNKSLDRHQVMDLVNAPGYAEVSYSTLHKRYGKRGVKLGRSYKTT